MRAITRKCSICKEPIYINDTNEDFFITLKNETKSYTHTNCYIEKQTTKKRNAKTIEECNEHIQECRKDYELYLQQKKLELEEKEKKKQIEAEEKERLRALKKQEKERLKQLKLQEEEKIKNSKIALYEFLFEMYGITFLPDYFFIKMASVYNGTMKNLNRPVPAEDLLDMWKQKQSYLNKVAENNRKKGNEITGVGRINYDLAILLSRYDSYLEWKTKQEVVVAELNESKKRSIENVEYTDVARPKNKTINNKKIDINSMIDEI